MSAKDGGPVFPTTDYSEERAVGVTSGMSMRQFYAAQALPSVITTHAALGLHNHKEIAEECFAQADAMIAAERSTLKKGSTT